MSKGPKPKDDVLNPELSKQLAWRMVAPLDAPEEPQAPPSPPKDEAPARDEEAEAVERAKRIQAFANAILEVWNRPSLAEQQKALPSLLRRACRLGFEIVCMVDHPSAALRLMRLVTRHVANLKIGSNTLFALSWMPLPGGHPEMAEVVVEVATSGNDELVFVLDRALERAKLEGKHPGLGKRLVEVFETAQNEYVRATALRLLSIDEFPEAIPTLQKALRLPNSMMRYYALAILEQMKEPALRTEDMQWLLDDAVKHPFTRDFGRNGYARIHNYSSSLIAALIKCPPPEGWKPLEVIADGGGVYVRRDRYGLDRDWALEALAATYPERALARIDHNLTSPNENQSFWLVKAIGRLPDEMARPRLLRMTGDADGDAVQSAIKIWFERFGQECPVDPLAGVPVKLLAAPPSERMLANLTALRSKSHEIRNAMLDVLLQDLPEPETPPTQLDDQKRESLALLLFIMRKRGNAYRHPTLSRISSPNDLAKFFLKLGGSLVFDVLAEWADEGIRAGVRGGWLDGLADAANLLDADQIERLRVMARFGLEHPRLKSRIDGAQIRE